MSDLTASDWRQWLEQARACGWLRSVDLQFAELLARHEPETEPLALVSAALVSGVLAQGHICLPLAAALVDLGGLLNPAGTSVTDLPAPQLPKDLTYSAWCDVLANSAVVAHADAGRDSRPLVLAGGTLYLRRYWQYQETIARDIDRRLSAELPETLDLADRLDAFFQPLRDSAERDREAVHWQSVAAAVATRRRFTVISGGPGTGKTTTVVRLLGLLQQLALDIAGRPLRIRLAAPTGKAAARLTESIGAAIDQLPVAVRTHVPAAVTTLHRLLRPLPNSRAFRHHSANPLHLDLLVVDEASMVDLEMMAHLVEALPPNARLILLGDKDQLASVEAGAVLSELCRDSADFSAATATWLAGHTGYNVANAGAVSRLADQVTLLRKSHRFHGASGIGRLAAAINAGDAERANTVWMAESPDLARCNPSGPEHPDVAQLVITGGLAAPGTVADLFAEESPADARPQGYQHYLTVLRERRPAAATASAVSAWASAVLDAFGRFQVLAGLRRGPWGVEALNRRIERLLAAEGLLEPTDGWYEGRPVMVTRNDYGLGLMNGDVGIALNVQDGSGTRVLRVFFPVIPDRLAAAPDQQMGNKTRAIAPSRLAHVETVFAMTVHKAQGSEFEHTLLAMPEQWSPLLTRELVYTAVTRARRWFTLVAPAAQVWDQALARRVVRASGLADRLAELDRSMADSDDPILAIESGAKRRS